MKQQIIPILEDPKPENPFYNMQTCNKPSNDEYNENIFDDSIQT